MLEHRIANFPNYVICDSSVSYLTHNLARVRVADLVGCLRVRTNARASSLVITCGHPWRLWRHRGPQLISMTHRSLVTVYDVLAPNYVIRCVSCRLFSPRLVSIRYLVSLRHQHLLMTSSSLRKLMSSFIFTTRRQQSVAWEDLLLAHVDNVDDIWEVFKNELLNRIETFIPICTKFYVKMHHGHTEMTTQPKFETGS